MTREGGDDERSGAQLSSDDEFLVPGPSPESSEPTDDKDELIDLMSEILLKQFEFNISVVAQLHTLSKRQSVEPKAVTKLLEQNTNQLELYQKLQILLRQKEGGE